jgi:signal transduction histidine kinase
MTRFFVAIVSCLIPALCLAQHSNIDSLTKRIANAEPDSNKVALLNTLVSQLREIDIDKAAVYAEEARLLASRINFKKGLGHALENLGWLSYRRGDFTSAFEISRRAIQINESVNAHGELAQCFNTIAAINFEQEQYLLAISNFKTAYTKSKRIDDSKTMTRSLNNIAFCFITLHQTDSARFYVLKALKKSEGSRELYMLAFSKRILGDVFLEDGLALNAIDNYNQCLEIGYKLNNNSLITSTLHRLGKVYTNQQQPDKALGYLLKNIALSKRHGYRDELEKSYKLASEAYALKKEMDKAYDFQSRYVFLHDSIYSQRNSERLSLMQVKFDSEMKQAEIDLLTKDADLGKEKINRQQVWMLFYAGSLTLVVLLVFVLYYNNKRFKKINTKLERQNEYIQRQTEMLSNLNTTKDKLFSIISHDLRSPVASLKGLMDILKLHGLSKEEFIDLTQDIRQSVDFLYDDLENLLQWAQSQLKGLQSSPQVVDLKTAVDEKISLFQSAARTKSIAIHNDVEEGVTVFADKNHIGLILRNLIGNAVKFNPKGGHIRVEYKMFGNTTEVSVSDSGVGISKEDLHKLFNAEVHFTKLGTRREKGMGIGLLITKEFVEINGGSISVSSEVGKGSTFTFSIRNKHEDVLIS